MPTIEKRKSKIENRGPAAGPDPVAWFRECLGPLPPRGPIKVEPQGTSDVGPWRAEWLRFRCLDQEPVTAVLVRPEGARRPPVVIAHHGYGEGKDIFTFGPHSGFAFGPRPGAAGLVDHGLAVLALDAVGHGPRLAAAPDRSQGEKAWLEVFETNWQWLARRCIIDGVSLQGLMIHDVQCAIDYLESREDVDASRLGMFGYSMGGTTCWSAAVVEPRIKAAVAGGCLLNYDTALRIHRDAAWHAWVPRLRRHAGREELVASIAPRPLLAIHGKDDFPREGVDPILKAAARSYGAQGCPDRFRAVFLPGGHVEAAQNPQLLEEAGAWLAHHLQVK